ncbi:hypothetical protein A8L34_11460 [Bacillus sp. FJAT-27264]|uniref:hypothetical protein n=1 Tax=Paenibacillus sp. (strain DSM 101736 / FJAT-27264) TaxID=1850362 RepID=UPI000807F00B|nr:hypothetical protein [Bacillus sp. FJAT-27264]OBZ14538.1 hypothetical protein A8L34_11460 [Bacillus sp. FJAT-27264]
MKNKTRKLLLRKYAILLLLCGLSLLYLYLGDWMFGYGLDNISYILNYLLYTTSEKLTAAIMLLCLVIPDIKQWITGHQPERGGER